jgi:hypothetical protein
MYINVKNLEYCVSHNARHFEWDDYWVIDRHLKARMFKIVLMVLHNIYAVLGVLVFGPMICTQQN